MQALVRPFPDSLRQPPELFAAKIRRRVRCTKWFCCSAAKPRMHVVNTESLRVFRALLIAYAHVVIENCCFAWLGYARFRPPEDRFPAALGG